METESIKLPKEMMKSIRNFIKKTNLFRDENDFIEQAIIKQLSKFKDL